MEGCGDLRGGRVAEVVSERQELRLRPETSRRNGVLLAASVLIAIQLGFRAWASFRGWFYADDFEFLAEAVDRPLSPGYLLAPQDSQLMPGGVLASWLVERSGTYNWALAASILLGLQALADLACLWMLVRLFGTRWGILPLLGLYLFSTLTLTSYMWWSSALNQVPMQAAAFAAIGLHVTYLRHGRARHAWGTAGALAVGLCFYVKTVLVLGPLAVLTLTHFTDWSGGVRPTLRRLLRRHRTPLAIYGGLAVAYLGYYAARVPNPVSGDGDVPYLDLADTMLRRTLGPGLFGGPWRWANDNAPVAFTDAPAWSVTLSWALLVLVVGWYLRARPGSWRALVVLAPYVAAAYLLTARGRGTTLGALTGLEPRYLADSLPVLVLAAGLLALPLPGSRPAPGEARVPRVPAAVLAAAVVIGAILSNVTYARYWAEPYQSRAFVENVRNQSRTQPLRVLDQPVPEKVITPDRFPANLPSHVFAPLGDRVVGLEAGTDLDTFTPGGLVVPPVIAEGPESAPGPEGDCGYEISGSSVALPMRGEPPDYFWWASVSYLADRSGSAVLSIAGREHRIPIEPGLHRFLMRGEGPSTPVTLSTGASGPVLCVDAVEIGQPIPLEPP